MLKVSDYIIHATELTAISVSKLIKEKGFSPTDILTEEESKAREKLIDQAGVDAMFASLSDIPFVLDVVGSEGRKHMHQYGEALPTLMGTFGAGQLKRDSVNDVVEGSKAAKLNLPGAVSVMAVSSEKGLMPTPSDIDYMDKLFGPPQLKGKISIKNSTEENLRLVVDTFKVKPSKINVVIMDRDRNSRLINACRRFGVNVILINAGDFLPSILSCLDPNTHKKGIHLIMGIGGFEEGIMGVVGAKALNSVGEGRGWSPEGQIQNKYKSSWTIDELVPGKRKDCLVSISAITDDKWFDVSGVKQKSKGFEVTTVLISEAGVKITRKTHH